MWDDWDRLMKQVAKTSQQFIKALEEFRGPEPLIQVHDQDRQVKVVITPVPEQNIRRWTMRVDEDRLYIRGLYSVDRTVRSDNSGFQQELRSDEFMKALRLPAPVEPRPSTVRKDGKDLTVYFAKKKEPLTDGWFDLQP